MKDKETLFFAILLFFVAIIMSFFLYQNYKCEKNNGVYVQTMFGMKCIK